jgi:hypothetical protein
MDPTRKIFLYFVRHSGLSFVGVLIVYVSILCVWFKWFTGLWPDNTQQIYYSLMTNWSGLGDSTELSRMGLSPGESRDRHLSGRALTAPTIASRILF